MVAGAVAPGMVERSVGGERFTSADQAGRRYAAGRECAERACGTRLSIYNDGDFCSLHQPREALRFRGTKIA